MQVVESFKMNFTKGNLDYPFKQAKLKFSKSTVCLEPKWYEDLNVFKEMYDKINDMIEEWQGTKEELFDKESHPD